MISRPSTRRTGAPPGDRPVPLAEFAWRAYADRTATRLQAEGIAAAVWEPEAVVAVAPADPMPIGPTVMVRQRDHADAAVLVRLFAEVDQGRSAVAPPPRSMWAGPWPRIALGIGLLTVLCFAVALLVSAAFPG